MGQLKNAFEDFLSAEDFDLMFDDEYELWLKDKQKRDKGIHIISNELDKSYSIKEQSYYASDVYGEYILQKQALAEKVGITQNKRAKECLVIDVWRTLEASRRKNNL